MWVSTMLTYAICGIPPISPYRLPSRPGWVIPLLRGRPLAGGNAYQFIAFVWQSNISFP